MEEGTRKRKREEHQHADQEGGRGTQKISRHDEEEKTMLHFEELPIEVIDNILGTAIEGDALTLFIASLVCHQWHAIVSHPSKQNSIGVFKRKAQGGFLLVNTAAKRGHKGLLRWLKEALNLSWNESTCAAAAKGGNLEMLQWLIGQGCPMKRDVAHQAARKGYLAILEWLLEEKTQSYFNSTTWAHAALGGQMGVIEWASEKLRKDIFDGIRGKKMGAWAAWGGQLDTLKWLVKTKGILWNSKVCTNAARNGHLELLQWARQNGCPWNPEACAEAASAGNPATDVLDWLASLKKE